MKDDAPSRYGDELEKWFIEKTYTLGTPSMGQLFLYLESNFLLWSS